MAQQSVEIGFPYYQAGADGSSETGVHVTFRVDILPGGTLGGVTEDDVADHIRDYLAGLSGATSSEMFKFEVDSSAL